MSPRKLVTTLDMVTADDVELVPDQFLESTALSQAPAPEQAWVELDQATVGDMAQTAHRLADAQARGIRHPLLTGEPDAAQGVQDNEIGVGPMRLIHLVGVEGLEPPTPGL